MIDEEVAQHWRENYDLSHILRARLGDARAASLAGKIHIYVGDMDKLLPQQCRLSH